MFPLGRWNEVKKRYLPAVYPDTHTHNDTPTQIAFPKQNDFALK